MHGSLLDALKGQGWHGILGLNSHGRRELKAALRDKMPEIRVLDAGSAQALLDEEIRNDDSDFAEGGLWKGRTVRAYLQGISDLCILRALGLSAILERGLSQLSSGELRRVQIAEALGQQGEVPLVIDHPGDSLDGDIQTALRVFLGDCARNRRPPWCLILADQDGQLPDGLCHVHDLRDSLDFQGPALSLPIRERLPRQGPLLRIKGLRVAYDEEHIIDGLDWQLDDGEHTRIRGPNGCGKTTLLKIISGDHPQVYANDVLVCGFQRGQGENVWELKAYIGWFTGRVHQEFLRVDAGTALDVLVSGFHDSIGLYCRHSEQEYQLARLWLDYFGREDLADVAFRDLDFAEQRAILIVRSAIKLPRLLILDEPCTGLDPEQRHRVLALAANLARLPDLTLLHVSHSPDEWISGTRRLLDFVAETGRCQASGRPVYRHIHRALEDQYGLP